MSAWMRRLNPKGRAGRLESGQGFPEGENSCLVPPQVSAKYVAEVVSQLHRVRAELHVEKAEVERLHRAVARPFAVSDTTANA